MKTKHEMQKFGKTFMKFSRELKKMFWPSTFQPRHILMIFLNFRVFSASIFLQNIHIKKACMELNDLISTSHHWDCLTTFLVCVEKWAEILEANDCVDVVYTDFAKAFEN